jgi:hypothetical protein
MLDELTKKAIKQITEQKGWEYIEALFKEEILEGKKPLNFKTEGKTHDMIAIEAIAREQAAKMVNSVLAKIKRVNAEDKMEKQEWK